MRCNVHYMFRLSNIHRCLNGIHAYRMNLNQNSLKSPNRNTSSLVPLMQAERGHPPNKHGQTSSYMETVIIAPLKRRKKKLVFCGTSVVLTAPEERSRDHICSTVRNRRGFENAMHQSRGSTLTAHKRGACVSVHPLPPLPRFSAHSKQLALFTCLHSQHACTCVWQQTAKVDIKVRRNEVHHQQEKTEVREDEIIQTLPRRRNYYACRDEGSAGGRRG